MGTRAQWAEVTTCRGPAGAEWLVGTRRQDWALALVKRRRPASVVPALDVLRELRKLVQSPLAFIDGIAPRSTSRHGADGCNDDVRQPTERHVLTGRTTTSAERRRPHAGTSEVRRERIVRLGTHEIARVRAPDRLLGIGSEEHDLDLLIGPELLLSGGVSDERCVVVLTERLDVSRLTTDVVAHEEVADHVGHGDHTLRLRRAGSESAAR